jgi:hypothetical protein
MQMILLARGIWISQRQARSLAGCGTSDLILTERKSSACKYGCCQLGPASIRLSVSKILLALKTSHMLVPYFVRLVVPHVHTALLPVSGVHAWECMAVQLHTQA